MSAYRHTAAAARTDTARRAAGRRRAVRSRPAVAVLGSAADADELLALAERRDANAVLLSPELPALDAGACARLRSHGLRLHRARARRPQRSHTRRSASTRHSAATAHGERARRGMQRSRLGTPDRAGAPRAKSWSGARARRVTAACSRSSPQVVRRARRMRRLARGTRRPALADPAARARPP